MLAFCWVFRMAVSKWAEIKAGLKYLLNHVLISYLLLLILHFWLLFILFVLLSGHTVQHKHKAGEYRSQRRDNTTYLCRRTQRTQSCTKVEEIMLNFIRVRLSVHKADPHMNSLRAGRCCTTYGEGCVCQCHSPRSGRGSTTQQRKRSAIALINVLDRLSSS